jgi:ribulose 1,5-bisphosphate synthetase/thiazole synthase
LPPPQRQQAQRHQQQPQRRRLSSAATVAAMTPRRLNSGHYDLLIVGSGPAAQKCAVDSAKLGRRVAVVDKLGMMGGVCVHTGTIPSKTFRCAARAG